MIDFRKISIEILVSDADVRIALAKLAQNATGRGADRTWLAREADYRYGIDLHMPREIYFEGAYYWGAWESDMLFNATHAHADRAADCYPTPPVATTALIAIERLPSIIWEPAVGQGHIAKVLQGVGFEGSFAWERKRRGKNITSARTHGHISASPPMAILSFAAATSTTRQCSGT
jgi:hypothetical protein